MPSPEVMPAGVCVRPARSRSLQALRMATAVGMRLAEKVVVQPESGHAACRLINNPNSRKVEYAKGKATGIKFSYRKGGFE